MNPDAEKKQVHIAGLCWSEALKKFRNRGKTLLWFSSYSPECNSTPIALIQTGNEVRLLEIVKLMEVQK